MLSEQLEELRSETGRIRPSVTLRSLIVAHSGISRSKRNDVEDPRVYIDVPTGTHGLTPPSASDSGETSVIQDGIVRVEGAALDLLQDECLRERPDRNVG